MNHLRRFCSFRALPFLAVFLFIAGCKTSPPSAPADSPPTVAITSPVNGEYCRLVDTVFVNASDDKAVTKVELYINGILVDTDNSSPWRFIMDTEQLPDGDYTLYAKAYDNASHSTTSASLIMSILNAFPVTFYNTLYTTMSVTVLGVTQSVLPDDSVKFTLSTNPRSLVYSASTSGKTSGGTTVGLVLSWGGGSNAIDVSHYTSYQLGFGYSSSYFFLYIKNTGATTLGPLYVNYGLTSQTRDDIALAQNSSASYRIGYYRAYTNTQVRAYWAAPYATTYSYWDQGSNFTFPGGTSQYVLLTNISPSIVGGVPGTNFNHVLEAPPHDVLEPVDVVSGTKSGRIRVQHMVFALEQ